MKAAISNSAKLPAVMHCPQCHAEYRQGYTSCADCNVLLVRELPEQISNAEGQVEPGDPNRDPYCAFWQGDDPRIHVELCTVLEEAGIPHKTVHRQDHLFNLSNYAAYQIGVPASLYEKSEAVVKEAFGLDSPEAEGVQLLEYPEPLPDRSNLFRKLPEVISPPENENLPGPPTGNLGADWFEEDATIEIWSGGNTYLGRAVLASLNENDIPSRWASENGASSLFVLPADGTRAREIVREILESSPPE